MFPQDICVPEIPISRFTVKSKILDAFKLQFWSLLHTSSQIGTNATDLAASHTLVLLLIKASKSSKRNSYLHLPRQGSESKQTRVWTVYKLVQALSAVGASYEIYNYLAYCHHLHACQTIQQTLICVQQTIILSTWSADAGIVHPGLPLEQLRWSVRRPYISSMGVLKCLPNTIADLILHPSWNPTHTHSACQTACLRANQFKSPNSVPQTLATVTIQGIPLQRPFSSSE